MTVPDDFVSQIKKDEKAFVIYQSLIKASLYSIAFTLSQITDKIKRKNKIEKIISNIDKYLKKNPSQAVNQIIL